MNLLVLMAYFYALAKMSDMTQTYIMINPTIEPADKPRLLALARMMHFGTIVATLCFFNSLALLH